MFFFIIVLSTFTALSSYVYIRGLQALPPVLFIKVIYSVIFFSGLASFFLRMFLGDSIREKIAVGLSAVGFTWIVALVYFAMFLVLLDLIRAANGLFDIYPLWIKENYQKVKLILFAGSSAAILVLLVIGNIRFNNPVVTEYNLQTSKPLPGGKMKIVLASDIHLSSYINKKDLKRYVSLINGQKGDVIMLAGDIADRDPHPLYNQKMNEELSQLTSKYGVFAITGNHEFYGGKKEEIYNLIKSAGITFLKDSAVLVAGSFYVAGRDDRTNGKRASLDKIMANVDRNLPVFLMDHQPSRLDEAMRAGADLQMSGHTHNGQFWPGNLIVSAMFELSYGHLKKGETNYIVTSGLGLWGPKYRIGTKSEIVVINLTQLPASAGTTTAESAAAESAESTAAKSAATAKASAGRASSATGKQ